MICLSFPLIKDRVRKKSTIPRDKSIIVFWTGRDFMTKVLISIGFGYQESGAMSIFRAYGEPSLMREAGIEGSVGRAQGEFSASRGIRRQQNAKLEK
jgi:hypothetical protein